MLGLFLASFFVTYYIGALWLIAAMISFDVYLFHTDDKSIWYSIFLQIVCGLGLGYWLRFLDGKSRWTTIFANDMPALTSEADRYIIALASCVLFGVIYPLKLQMPITEDDPHAILIWIDIGRLISLSFACAFAVIESAISRKNCTLMARLPALTVIIDCLIFPSINHERIIVAIGIAIYVFQTAIEYSFMIMFQ